MPFRLQLGGLLLMRGVWVSKVEAKNRFGDEPDAHLDVRLLVAYWWAKTPVPRSAATNGYLGGRGKARAVAQVVSDEARVKVSILDVLRIVREDGLARSKPRVDVTEAALRRVLAALRNGELDYDDTRDRLIEALTEHPRRKVNP